MDWALTDTDRDELRERITLARDRFDQLIRTADPRARARGSDWTVQETAAHVLTVAQRYLQVGRGLEFRRAQTLAEMPAINQAELEAVLAPVAEIADGLRGLEPELDAMFDRPLTDEPEYLFHGGVVVSDVTGQTNWLAELLVHGLDVARAVNAPWQIAERDAVLMLRGMMQIAPAAVRSDLPPDRDIRVVLEIPGARPYLLHIHDGIAETRARRPEDRPHAVLRAPASTLQLLLYHRISPLAAVRRGLRIAGGRRPWKALALDACFQTG